MSDIEMGRPEANSTALDEPSEAEEAYSRIREMIVTGVLAPGQVINEKDLVRATGTGRTPVREAIQRLASQHVVTIFPRRGMAVAKLGLSDIQAIFEARETIEAKAAELAALRRSEDEARQLQELGQELLRVTHDDDFKTFLDIDQRLHHFIADAARNLFLAESADQLLMLSNWAWHQYFQIHGSTPTSYFDHESIIRAIIERDSARAAALMHEHIEQSREVIRNTM